MRFESILSKRETECLGWVAKGKTSSEVSQILGISERTVNFHINNSMEKFDAVNRTHLIALYVKSYVLAVLEDIVRRRCCHSCCFDDEDPILDKRTTDFICRNLCGPQKAQRKMGKKQ